MACLLLWALPAASEDTFARVNVTINPSQGALVAVPFMFTARFRNGTTVVPAAKFVLDHESFLHVIVMGGDLDTFGHLHAKGVGGERSRMGFKWGF